MADRTPDMEQLSDIASRAARRLGAWACILADLRREGRRVLAFSGVSAAEADLLLAAHETRLRGKACAVELDGDRLPGGERALFLAHDSRPIEGGRSLSISCFDKKSRDIPGALGLLGLWAEEAVQRLVPGTGGERALEANTSVYTPAFFLRYIEAETAAGSKAGLLVFHVDRLQEVRRDRGEQTAARLLAQLGDLLRSRARSGDVLGRIFEDSIGMLLPEASPGTLPAAVSRLRDKLKEGFRFGVSIGGCAASAPDAVLEGARRALAAAAESGGNRTQLCLEGRLVEPEAPAKPAAEAAGPGALFQERYQKLVLLNRAALNLFSGEALESSLASAGHTILALSGAKYISIHQADGGRLSCLHRHGEKLFLSEEARGSEASLLERLRADLADCWLVEPGLGLLGVPILAASGEARFEGALITGYPRDGEPPPEVARLLADTAKLLHNAFVVHGQLREQKRLAAVAEQSADPLLLTDLEGRILAFSRGALDTFRYSPGEVLGRTAADLLVPRERRERYLGLERETLEKGSILSVEGIHLRSDGTPIPVEMTFTLVRDDQGKPFEMVRMVRDIRQRKEVERMKTEFVNIVSHELRTPLTSIRGFADTLIEFGPTLPQAQKDQYLRIILEESMRLARLVDDFLDVSRLEAGASHLRKERIDVKALAGRVAQTLGENRAGVRFELDFEEGLPSALADPDQVQRAIINLSGNALKYSPKNGVIRIRGRRDGDCVEVCVEDQGPGIAPESRKKLFQKFYRAGDEISIKTPGTGLGLYIVKSIVDSHGGAIRLESELGKGTKVSFTLPIDPPQAPIAVIGGI